MFQKSFFYSVHTYVSGPGQATLLYLAGQSVPAIGGLIVFLAETGSDYCFAAGTVLKCVQDTQKSPAVMTGGSWCGCIEGRESVRSQLRSKIP